MSILFYGLVLLGSFTIALVVYVLAMIRWRCACTRYLSHSELRSPAVEKRAVVLNLTPYSVSAIQYKKGVESTEPTHETECAVCLIGFNDEERLQQLPRCRHLFHASCIDMWLYSHSDCPLCRAPVERLGDTPRVSLTIEESSRDGQLDVLISS